MKPLPRFAFIASVLLVAIDVLPAYAQCVPGITTVSVALPELAYQPGSSMPYYVSVSDDAVPFTAVSASGSHCRLVGTSARVADFHPFVNPTDADVVAPIPLVRARFDVTLDIRPSEAPPTERCNYDGLDGECFHASQDPTANPDEAARWTAHVRLVSTGTDESVTAYDVTYWVNLAQLQGPAGPIISTTPLADVVTAAATFSEQEAWDHLKGLLPIAWLVEPRGPFTSAFTDSQGRQAGRTTPNDIPFSTSVTNGADSAIVIVNPQDGLYHVVVTGTPSATFTLLRSRVDFSRGLRYPVVDELNGTATLSATWTTSPGTQRVPFRMEAPPVEGPSPFERLIQVGVEAEQFFDRGILFVAQSPSQVSSFQNEYRLAPAGHGVLHMQSFMLDQLTDKWAHRRHREQRSGRDPNAYDAVFQWLISEIVASSRELTVRGLADGEAFVNVQDPRAMKKIVAARDFFALAEQYLAAGDPITAVERVWYTLNAVSALYP